MLATTRPILVATFGNTMAGDDAFGQLVGDRVRAMELQDVAIAQVGAQPYGLVHRLEDDHPGLVIVDASLATQEISAGQLLDLDFLAPNNLQLVHDIVVSTHGLSVANELELARRLHVLPPRVRLVTATVEHFEVGSPPTVVTQRLVEPAAICVARIVRQWRSRSRRRQNA